MFLSSLAPDITEDIPTPLSGGGVKALEQSGDARFDVSVNGLPFNLRISTYTPYRREGEQVRKEQFDTSGEAGEQSLSTWWIRSQTSWHMGAGIRYYDPGSEKETADRFATSQGIDIWQQGQLSLLNSMTQDEAGMTEPCHLSTFRSQGRDGWVRASNNSLAWRGGEAPGGTLVRHNRSYNPRIKALSGGANNWTLGGGPAVTDTSSGTGGPTGVGYRAVSLSANGTVGMFTSDRGAGTLANPVGTIAVGEDITYSAYFRSSWTGAATVTATITVVWYNSSGTFISSEAYSEELVNGAWTRLAIRDERPVGANYVRATMRFDSSASVNTGNSFMVSSALLEEGLDLLNWFDGAITDTAQHNYAWAGTVDDSISSDTYTPGTTQTLPSGQATQPAPVGGSVYVGRTGGVSKWDVNADVLTNPYTCTGVARCWWVKDRLIVAVGKDLHWVDHTVTGTIPGANTQLIASGVDDDWVWVDVTDTADAILAVGSGETASSVFALTVEDVEGVPVFTAPREVARLPQGEQATCCGSYLASFVVLGTTKGVRVGATGQNGQIQLGGLSVELTEAPQDVTFFDRFAYLPVSRALPDGTTGVVRVDLSEEVVGEGGSTGLFPWAWDVYPGGSVADATSIAMNGNTGKVVLAHGATTHVATDDYLESGYLDSGLIRYATTEMKDYQRARVAGDLHGGTVRLSALINGQPSSVYTYGLTTGLEGESTLNLPGGPLFAELAFRLTLTREGPLSPTVSGLTIKAMPSVTKSRLYSYPLSVYDFESGRYGDSVGYEGFGIDRIQELEELENRGSAVQILDRRYNEALVATIESLTFNNYDPPDGTHDNGGGTVMMVVRVR